VLYIDSWGLIGFLKVGSISYQTPFLSNFQAFCPVLSVRIGSYNLDNNHGQKNFYPTPGDSLASFSQCPV
jgi:hypothetical protein